MTTVLVIEDNEDNRVLITRLLERSGYKTAVAVNGKLGFDMALSVDPDFILLDVQLPDIDGVQVLKMLRETNKTKDIPVVAITSYAMSGDRERFLARGCNGYIEKPIDPTNIIRQIEQIIGQST